MQSNIKTLFSIWWIYLHFQTNILWPGTLPVLSQSHSRRSRGPHLAEYLSAALSLSYNISENSADKMWYSALWKTVVILKSWSSDLWFNKKSVWPSPFTIHFLHWWNISPYHFQEQHCNDPRMLSTCESWSVMGGLGPANFILETPWHWSIDHCQITGSVSEAAAFPFYETWRSALPHLI